MGIEWLIDLEKRVADAAEEIERLRKQNHSLRSKVRQMEKDLGERKQEAGAAGGWQRERRQIRGRVEKLAATLEGLLEE